MDKTKKHILSEYISKKYLKKEFVNLPTPIRILIYGGICGKIEQTQYLINKYGIRKLEKIWERNRIIGSNHKDWNNEIG